MKAIRTFLFVFLAVACTKEDYRSIGTIVGIDYTKCACCGGWQILIDDTMYLIDAIPDNSDLDLEKETLPVTVKLDWHLVNNGCSAFNRITVERIKEI